MLRRYWPPTSYSAREIWPSEQHFTVSISSANTLPPVAATACRRRSASALPPRGAPGTRAPRRPGRASLPRWSGSAARPHARRRRRSARNVLTPMIGSEPSCFASRSTGTLPGSCRAGTSSPSRRARRRARRSPRTPCRPLPRPGRSAPSITYEPCHGFWFLLSPSSRLMMSWIATARRTLSSVGVVSASS